MSFLKEYLGNFNTITDNFSYFAKLLPGDQEVVQTY